MTVDEWLDEQIKQGYVHPDYKRIYHWILDNFKKYEEKHISGAEDIPEFPCAECGSSKNFHKKWCSKR